MWGDYKLVETCCSLNLVIVPCEQKAVVMIIVPIVSHNLLSSEQWRSLLEEHCYNANIDSNGMHT